VTPRFKHFLLATAIYFPVILLVDTRGIIQQLLFGLVTAAFLVVFAPRSNLRATTVAIIVATTGEVVLSLGWGLYTYRNALIPLYVPFGHGVFYALAAESAHQQFLQKHAKRIAQWVLVAGSVNAIVSLLFFHDQWGLLWWIGALTLIARSRNQLMLCACFVYTMPLEWIGTAIGNWHWSAVVPFVGLRSANPPSGVGILYILLDLITVAICTKAANASEPAAVIEGNAVA
jgi:hypothetical protein